MPSFKEKVQQFYIEMVVQKIDVLRNQQEDIMESLRHETKSTAGDKYETSRAMLHMEQENIALQLSVLMQQKAVLDSMETSVNTASVQFGSLVKTNKGFIFLGVALGKASIENHSVFSISPESPLGKLLMGKMVGDVVNVQAASYEIEGIY
jgi:transcription elongation GreA/GreB family factor